MIGHIAIKTSENSEMKHCILFPFIFKVFQPSFILFMAQLCCNWALLSPVLCVYSEKLTRRQASRRDDPQAYRRGKKKTAEPFFPGSNKNALIITGGWLVSFLQKPKLN